ncbi:hypothetical protein ATB99_10890 [Elizabethkingia meningoseptica]|uniref:hypothetical protein n=1 Tax=Elizabethkingia meningoseptica TaxID=238 RepID=UPI000332C13C|nr:hypothetical protein [Elizabethkingia meningoseptica]AQX06869.1 hypothetical protein BBD33_17080 [Elizabethkingia meningoseptica]AQX48915.1 hypothetical protein B5G46_17065 [Elizabethkingia meningoseptica]EOR29419.1 hypothetical protein L100_11248 [Elizabethkingia meningoseptica ATCC 13253 = NBRC 12535]KUY15001.1 hypothetical protein ATB99_10890 [Elizabethkingia meningoseptica]MVW93097.1 hypothetical protein [Elizabethkingia meningoseptica]
MTKKSLKRRLNFLTGYVIISSVAFLIIILSGFRNKEHKENMDELTVKRINVVDEKGNLRMVISNEHRQHPGIVNGEKLPARERSAGIIFFNSYGDECGGLVYDGNEKDAGLVLSVDKFRDDQIMQLQYMEDTKTYDRKYGLQIWDYPKENTFRERNKRFNALDQLKTQEEKQKAIKKMRTDSLLMEDRLFIGKKFSKEVGLFINDEKGKPRIKIYVDKNNTPKIELLNENGKVIP